jgi:hypothetical protein
MFSFQAFTGLPRAENGAETSTIQLQKQEKSTGKEKFFQLPETSIFSTSFYLPEILEGTIIVQF